LNSSVTVLVIDNGSTDGSIDEIRANYPKSNILSTNFDQGYAGNNNFGIFLHEKVYNYLFILNEDTLLLDGCIEELVKELECDNTTGIVGPLVLNESDDGVVQSNGGWYSRRGTSGWIDFRREARLVEVSSREVVWIHGCALMIRWELFQSLSGFHTGYYYTWEEVDLCLRARKIGHKCRVVPKARLVHRDIPDNPSWTSFYYHYRNRYFCMWAHCSRFAVISEYMWDLAKQSVKQLVSGGKQQDSFKFYALVDILCRNHGRLKTAKKR